MRTFLRSLREIRRYIRRGSAQDVIKVCPICLEDNLIVLPNTFLGFLSPPFYLCRICGYKGAIFAEVERNQYENLKSTTEGNSFPGG